MLPTVRIKHPDPAMAAAGETLIINERDFDPAKHERADTEAKPKRSGRKKS